MSGRRRWRALDLGTTFAYVEADASRVYCKQHRVVVAQVPWARHNSCFKIPFEDEVCWMAVNMTRKAVTELMRVTWRTGRDLQASGSTRRSPTATCSRA